MKSIRLYITSGDNDDYPGCKLYLLGKKIDLPPILKPKAKKRKFTFLTKEQIEARGCDYYFEYYERRIGFSYLVEEGFLQIWLGGLITHDSETDQTLSFLLPWQQWRFHRKSIYGLDGELFWTSKTNRWDEEKAIQDQIPKRTFRFFDFDGEIIQAETHIEEREWRFGRGWFQWLSWFRKPKVRRCLDIQFDKEVGREKGSWKGGTMGHGIDMLPGERHEAAFKRYCLKHELAFIGDVRIPQ